MTEFTWQHFAWAVGLGVVATVSLPLGAWIGVRRRPTPAVLSAIAAFGAGALFTALTIELVAPKVIALTADPGSLGGDAHINFFSVVIGLTLGAILFVTLDMLVNQKGGFLRKTATVLSYSRLDKGRRTRKLLESISLIPLLRNLPTEQITTLVKLIKPASFIDGEEIVQAGDKLRSIYFMVEGTAVVRRDGALGTPDHQESVLEFGAGDTIGLAAVMMGSPAVFGITATTSVVCLELEAEDFRKLREISPEFDAACRKIVSERLERFQKVEAAQADLTDRWIRDNLHSLRGGTEFPTSLELRHLARSHGSVALAIWLGNLIDAIPESLVLGAGLADLSEQASTVVGQLRFFHVVPYTLVAGLFLSNFPEALSSSALMQNQGWSKKKILVLWGSLMVITAIGAGFGYLLGGILSHTWLVFTEGVAAGAMLTMIASALIPEAAHLGSPSLVGLSTSGGFIAALLFKLLE
jgi:CRP-like cAMP-binding protein